MELDGSRNGHCDQNGSHHLKGECFNHRIHTFSWNELNGTKIYNYYYFLWHISYWTSLHELMEFIYELQILFHDVVSKECSLSCLLNYESYLYVLLYLELVYIPFTNKNHVSITFR
ncbi:hypothetical protein Syun_001335 [Stephania yunnanensis]|uniref:Uncharacterized protein n=1 Tax=Stephania yunnanensis TaxID=152371 RepID=A0AAP0Q6D3_9MAGN